MHEVNKFNKSSSSEIDPPHRVQTPVLVVAADDSDTERLLRLMNQRRAVMERWRDRETYF